MVAKVSMVSSCNIIMSICRADTEKQERQYWKKIQNSKMKGLQAYCTQGFYILAFI